MSCRAPDGLAYNCSVCFNETTKTQFWGFVNAVINLQSLVNGNDSHLEDLRVTVSATTPSAIVCMYQPTCMYPPSMCWPGFEHNNLHWGQPIRGQ